MFLLKQSSQVKGKTAFPMQTGQTVAFFLPVYLGNASHKKTDTAFPVINHRSPAVDPYDFLIFTVPAVFHVMVFFFSGADAP